ncbi:MAG: RNA polymerase sigma factor [Chloroflexota bacterium]
MDADLRDRAADQAYRDHATEVYRVAYGILRDADEAIDATHDAFARAWERWEQYDSQRPLRAWLHGIVVHVALDQLRRRKVRRLAIPVLGRNSLTDANSGAGADPAIDIARRQVVDDALATLRPDARAALVLRHYYGYDYAQIAAFLGTNSGTVGSILSRAHAALRLRLENEPAAAARPGRSPSLTQNSNRSSVERSIEPPEVLP